MFAALEGSVLVEMVKQVAQLRQRIDMDDQPLPISLGLNAGVPFPRPDLVAASGVSLVAFLSSDCSACRAVGAAISQLPDHLRGDIAITPVVEARTPLDVEEFRRDTLLEEHSLVVDYDREIGRETGLGTRPSVLILHNGVMIEAAAIRTGRQLTSVVERANRLVSNGVTTRESTPAAVVGL